MPVNDRDELNLAEAFELARSGIQMLFAINGGAAASILAFYGQALTSPAGMAPIVRHELSSGLTCFAAGAATAASTLIIAYLSQLWISANYPDDATSDRMERLGGRTRLIAVVMAFAALVLFGVGAWHAGEAIETPPIAAVQSHR